MIMTKRNKYYTMNEAFEDYEVNGGVFSNNISYPWSSTIANELINDMYFSEYGECLAGSFILKCLKDNETLDNSSRLKISSIIAYRFMTKWSKLWDTLFFEYNPINNYDMTETENIEGTFESTGKNSGHSNNETNNTRTLDTDTTNNITYSRNEDNTQTFNNTDNITLTNNLTSSDTLTRNLTDHKTETNETTLEGSETQNKSLYGFNSTDAAPADKLEISKNDTTSNSFTGDITYTGTEKHDSTDDTTGTTTTAHTGTIKYNNDISDTTKNTTTDTGTITDSNNFAGDYTDNLTKNDSNTTNRTLTRSGNIGVTTSQQMIESERKLWLWDYFKEVFSDVNKLYTLPIF